MPPCCILEYRRPYRSAFLTCGETDIVPRWRRDVLKWPCSRCTIWLPVGRVSGTVAPRLYEVADEAAVGPAASPLSLSASLLSPLSVPLSLCISPSINLSALLCSGMILTDPLEGLRDSISRQRNGSVVRENLVAPPRCVLKGVMAG